MRITPKKVVLWVSLLLFAIVLLQNSDPTAFELLFWQVQMPLFVLILTTLFVGCTIGWLAHLAYAKGRKSVSTPTPSPKETSADKKTEEQKASLTDEAETKKPAH